MYAILADSSVLSGEILAVALVGLPFVSQIAGTAEMIAADVKNRLSR
jgi:hypothetical protein